MLNKEMVRFFESILEQRSDEFRITREDLASVPAFEQKQAKIRRKVMELLRLREVGERFGMRRLDEEMHVVSLPAPEVTVLSRVACDGYTREHWLMETLPGIHMPRPRERQRMRHLSGAGGGGSFQGAGRLLWRDHGEKRLSGFRSRHVGLWRAPGS